MPYPAICGATFIDGAGLSHTCDRRPHSADHLHAENSGEPTGPTPEVYAAYLEQLVRADIEHDPQRYGAARSFQDLHDVCDANEYLIETDDHFGYTEGVRPTATFIDQALAFFHARMGWTTTATVDYDAWAQAEAATLTGTADVRLDLPEPDVDQAARFIDPNVTGAFTATPAGFAAMAARINELRDTHPTVEEVGAKAIEMFKCDPNWWRRTYPLELAGLIDRWLEAHGEPIAKVILAGTRVRLRTVNGGDTICELATTYRPGEGCEFRQITESGTVTSRRWYRHVEDILSVDIAPPRNGLDRCTCGSKYWDGQQCHDCGQRWLGLSMPV